MIPKRLVLDTNVCLDLFVFRDPRWAKLLVALQTKKVEAVTREDCRREWQIVLDYPHLPLDEQTRRQSAIDFDALIHCVPLTPAIESAVKLPICKDPDDQKFLEIARDMQAEALITKDKALLKLARRTVRAGLFTIMPPDAWINAVDSLQDAPEQSADTR
jgi:putative PIN family toxin of toxin-antitoxin system